MQLWYFLAISISHHSLGLEDVLNCEDLPPVESLKRLLDQGLSSFLASLEACLASISGAVFHRMGAIADSYSLTGVYHEFMAVSDPRMYISYE